MAGILEDPYAAARAALLAEIEEEMRATSEWTGRGALAPAVADALASVPRHEFVPPAMRDAAYINHAMPIGWDQTISQPFIVALMTDLLEPRPGHVVLEIGTGSGYQAAVLSCLVTRVYSIEVVAALAERARADLERLGYDNVTVREGDGGAGWPEHAPYDGIIVTAAARSLPEPLVEQLRPGGRLVAPLGPPGAQQLTVAEKSAAGDIATQAVLPVAFVPFTAPR